jgi:Ni/Co efflux regulator RcnB
MLRNTLLAVAAVATLGTAASTDAFARSNRGHHDNLRQESSHAASAAASWRRRHRLREQAVEFGRRRSRAGHHRWTENFGFRGPDCVRVREYDGRIKLDCFNPY